MERISPTALTSCQCRFCAGPRVLYPRLHDSSLPTANGASDDRRRPPDERSHCNPADILQAVTVSSFMNLNNRDRFRVLREEIMTVGAFSNVATQSYAAGNQIVPINIYAKCNIPVCFEGTSAAIGSISSGAIYVFLIGNVAAGANDGIAQLSCRVRFIDA